MTQQSTIRTEANFFTENTMKTAQQDGAKGIFAFITVGLT